MLKKNIFLNIVISLAFFTVFASEKAEKSIEEKKELELPSLVLERLKIPDLSKIVLKYSDYIDNYILFSNFEGSTSKLAKYLYNGELDLKFGNKGIADCPCRNLVSIARDNINNKIYVVGQTLDSKDPKACLAAFDSNGRIDKNFGEGKGYILIDINPEPIAIGRNSIKISLDKNNKILYLNGLRGMNDLFRYNMDGSLDTKIKISDYKKDESINFNSLAYAKDDNILLGTGRGPWTNPYYRGKILSYILRLNNDGELDETFGDDGFVDEPYGRNILAIYQDNGHIITADYSGAHGYISKYDLDGSPDNSFGDEKMKTGYIKLHDIIPSILEVDDEGKILTAGLTVHPETTTLKIVRLLNDGVLDKTFANNGVFEKHFSHTLPAPNLPSGLILLKALFGKITIGGFIKDKNFLFRLNNDGSEDKNFRGVNT